MPPLFKSLTLNSECLAKRWQKNHGLWHLERSTCITAWILHTFFPILSGTSPVLILLPYFSHSSPVLLLSFSLVSLSGRDEAPSRWCRQAAEKEVRDYEEAAVQVEHPKLNFRRACDHGCIWYTVYGIPLLHQRNQYEHI